MPEQSLPRQGSTADFRLGWLRRGQDLNDIYDALTAAVGKSPTGDPVADIDALAAERDALHSALERLLANAEHIFAEEPVRDWGETLAEARAALERSHADV